MFVVLLGAMFGSVCSGGGSRGWFFLIRLCAGTCNLFLGVSRVYLLLMARCAVTSVGSVFFCFGAVSLLLLSGVFNSLGGPGSCCCLSL